MKKLLAILAAALLVVACGETKEKPKTIEDQLLEHLAKVEKALETGDPEKVSEAMNAWYGWSSSLSGEEAKEHEAAVEKHMERIMEINLANDEIWYGGDCEEYEEYEEYEECEECDYSNIEEQFEKYLTKIESAIADGDIEAAMAANDAMDEWYSSLDEEEMAAFEEATMTYATRTMRIASALEEMQYDDEGEDEYEDEDWE